MEAPSSGVVAAVDAQAVGLAAMGLGAGRATKDDRIDPAVGVVLVRKVGDPVRDGEPLADGHALTLDPVTLTLGDCSVAGCETPVGAQRPDFITVSMPGGYIVQPRIPYILVDPIPLKPQAVMAYGGGS